MIYTERWNRPAVPENRNRDDVRSIMGFRNAKSSVWWLGLCAGAIFLLLAGTALLQFQQSSIRILYDGVPAANLPVHLFGHGPIGPTDADGVVYRPNIPHHFNAGFNGAHGGAHLFKFPDFGRMEIDYRGRQTIVTIIHYDLGFISSKSISTQTELTEEETRQLKSGEVSWEDFQPEP